jgi:hypothetical protein
MKSFLKKLVLFLLPLLALNGLLEVRLSRMSNNFNLKKKYFESQLSEIEILIPGPSYGNSIDPQFLSHKAFNLFNDGEDIYYDARLIEKYLERMPKLKLIIFPLSYYSLEHRMDRSPTSWRIPFYQSVWGIPPQSFTSYLNPGFYSFTAAYGWQQTLDFIENDFTSEDQRVLFPNGWREIGSQVIAENTEWQRAGWQTISLNETLMHAEAIPENMALLSELIETCRARGIQIMFITTPLHHFYYDHLDPDKYERMQDNIRVLMNRYKVPYLNFMKDDRFQTTDFYNADHVSTAGAEKFSKIMDEEISQYLGSTK